MVLIFKNICSILSVDAVGLKRTSLLIADDILVKLIVADKDLNNGFRTAAFQSGTYRLINSGGNRLDDLIVVDDGVPVADSTDKLRPRLSGDKHLSHRRETAGGKGERGNLEF